MITPGKWRSAFARAWWERPGLLLVVFLGLYALSEPAAFSLSRAPDPGGRAAVVVSIPWFIVVPFLTWRVWRGGRISRVLLIFIGVVGYAAAAFRLARLWGPLELWLLVDFAAQVALLANPAVYLLTHPGEDTAGATAGPLAGRFKGWMLPWSLLAGLVVTLLFLGQMDWAAVPGCGPAGATLAHLPGRCIGLAEGYPLRFLFGYQGVPVIDKHALVKDWAQWSLVSGSILYASRFLWGGRQDVPTRAPDSPPVRGSAQRV